MRHPSDVLFPGEKPFPDESVKHAAPSTYLKQSKPKAKP